MKSVIKVKDYDDDIESKIKKIRHKELIEQKSNAENEKEKEKKSIDDMFTKAGGAYIPPSKLRALQEGITDKNSVAFQRMAWESLKKSINGLVNKVNISNIGHIVEELLQENIVRGRGLLAQSIIRAQVASPTFSNVYAALVSIINTKFPKIGELVLRRLILQFRRSFKMNDKLVCINSAKFIAHLVNQQVAHELLALEILTLLLQSPTGDSCEVAISFLKDVGLKLVDVSPRGINAIFERLRSILHDSETDKRVQYMIEVMFAIRKDGFKDYQIMVDDLNLVEEDDQITHLLRIDDTGSAEDVLNVFKHDPDYEVNEEKYKEIRKDILGENDDETSNGSENDDDDDDDDDENNEGEEGKDENPMEIVDRTETNLVALRRLIYLTVQSSLDFEECAHKMMKLNIKPGQEHEFCLMVVECCAQQRSFEKFYGLLGQRFCLLRKEFMENYIAIFKEQYDSCHHLETNKLRNTAKFFGHLLHSDAIPWMVMECIRLNEDDTTSSSRIFIKILFQELAEYLGIQKFNARLKDPIVAPYLEGIFPRDNPRDTRFSINFFTAIGLGGLTDELREHLKKMPKVNPLAKQLAEASGSSSDSSESSSSSNDSSDSSSSSEDKSSGDNKSPVKSNRSPIDRKKNSPKKYYDDRELRRSDKDYKRRDNADDNSSIRHDDRELRRSDKDYKRRRTHTRKLHKIFELDDEFEKSSNENNSHSDARLLGSNGVRSKLLKDELYHMIMRERETLENEYSTRVNNLLQSFKNKKLEWEEMVKLEREDLENQFERERSEMNAAFAHEIANLARISEEEKAAIGKQFEEKMKLREQELGKEKDNLKQFFLNESEKLKTQLLGECEEKLKSEQNRKNEKHINEKINFEKKLESSKAEIEASYKRQIEMLETKHDKICFELERKHAEEKIALEREFQRRLEISEISLRKETLNREEIERIASTEKNNTQAIISMLKEEIERFKEEIDRLKKQPIPCPEVRIIEKEVPNTNSILSFKSRMDLPPNLKDEFDFLLNEYKENLKDKYKSDNAEMEKKIEVEKGKLKEKFSKQKEELEKRLNEEKLRIEKDFNRNREDMEKEIERRLRTKQLQESLLDHQKRFDDSNRKLAEEDRLKLEKVFENENKRNVIIIQELTQENEGLKLKAKALEDNNQLLKNLKDEGQQEVDRLRNAVQELKIIVEEKKVSDKNPITADYSSLIMTLINQQQQKQAQQQPPDQNIWKKEEEIKAEKKKLEKLRLDLQQQEKDIKDRKNIEDAAKLALDKSHEKYENLLSEKNRLEKSLKSLEGKVFSMQDEFTKMKNTPQQQNIAVKPMYHGILENSDAQFTFIPIQSPNQTLNSPNTPLPFLHPNQSVMTNKIENLKKKLKDSQYGYSILEKEIRDRERQIEKLENTLIKEKEISSGLRDSLSEEKNKFIRFKDEKEREIKVLMKAKRSTEEVKLQLELEVQELKSKLQHAGQTLTAVRKQASDDLNSSYILQRDSNEVVRNLKSPGFSQTVASILASSEKRKVDAKYPSENKFVYVNSAPEDFERVRKLENDKKKLEVELESVKENLNNYTNKLENQLRKLELKVEQQNDFIVKRPVSKLDDDVNQDSLRNQKVHLQKLIGRLSALQH